MTIRSYCIVGALLLSAGCTSPTPYNGGAAPVVDRTSVAGRTATGNTSTRRVGVTAATAPGVEVTPLDQQQPLGPLAGEGEGLLVEDLPAPQPADLPAIERRPKPAPPPVAAAGEPSQAVVALLDSAAEHLGSQDLDKAANDLERAVRIEPGNAAIWHDLGQIRLHQSRYDDAMAMAAKSTGLAGSDSGLKARNWRLISVARRSLGDSAGADVADATASQLER